MKIIKFLLFAIMTISINSCNDADPETEPIIELQDEIGKWHNIALDLFFESEAYQNQIHLPTMKLNVPLLKNSLEIIQLFLITAK